MRHPAPNSCKNEATVFVLEKRTADPANSMHAGTNASRAICNVVLIALKTLHQGHTNKPLMCSAEVIEIANLEGHFVREDQPDLRDHGN